MSALEKWAHALETPHKMVAMLAGGAWEGGGVVQARAGMWAGEAAVRALP